MFKISFPIVRRVILTQSRTVANEVSSNTVQTKSTSSTEQSSSDSNQWLWEYLRHRQSYQSLPEERKQQVIQLELQTLRESGERVPDQIPDEYWPELLSAPLLYTRKSIYNYLFVREISKRKRAAEKAAVQERRAQSTIRHAELAAAGLPLSNYPGYKSIFRQLMGGQTERWLRDTKLMTQARLSDHLLIDCGYEVEHARSRHIPRLVDQIEHFFANIQQYHSPSFVTLCNLAIDGQIQKELNRRNLQRRAMSCFETTEENYLDLFDRQNLIYLSPHSPYEMTEYDHDAVYIIGAMTDGGVSGRPLSLAKAKRDNIKHQRIPLERFLKFGSCASRALSLDKVYNILMRLKHGYSWKEVLEVVPERKVTERFDQPRLGRNESGRWGTRANVRKEETSCKQ